jgi:aconitate hydratase
VVGKFVEFHGEGVAAVPLANRATIGNMSPEFGSTCAIFPIDDETLTYLRLTGRPAQQVALIEAYAKEQGLWHDPSRSARYSEELELDLSTIVPSLAGPKRPQDRVALSDAKASFRDALGAYVPESALDDDLANTFPASDPVASEEGGENGHHDIPAAAPAGAGAPRRRASSPTPVTMEDGTQTEVDHGSVVIAAITSCTNTSNPSVMIGAALLARKAVEAGLERKPWVKTTLAPGSKVVMDYYERAGLTPYLEKLGFNLVGYGCTTCIGNSGPLPEAVSAAVNEADLAVVSVLSGNRTFEGRINPDVKMNYLASPPLVVAYALAGTMDLDLTTEPIGTGSVGQPVYLADLWPSAAEVDAVIRTAVAAEMFTRDYASVFAGDDNWQELDVPGGDTFAWAADSTYVRRPPYFDGMPATPEPVTDVHGARVLAKLGDSVTTDHISPAGAIKGDGPAGKYLTAHGVERRDFNSYGSRRGNHEVMIRGTFANIRLRNQLAPGTEGGFTVKRVHRGRHPAGHPGRQGVRLGLVAGLGGQGHRAAGRAGRPGGVVRADPPVQPHRHGRAAPAVHARRERGVPGAHRHRGLRHHRDRGHELRGRAPRGHGAGRRQVVPGRAPHRHARRGRVLPARRDHAVRAAVAQGPRLAVHRPPRPSSGRPAQRGGPRAAA